MQEIYFVHVPVREEVTIMITTTIVMTERIIFADLTVAKTDVLPLCLASNY